VERDLGGRCWQGEHDMEVRHRQQFGLALGEPIGARQTLALRAVPVATRNGRSPLPALWADPVMGSWRARMGIFW
jgi:hypothetical protein